LLPHPDLAPLYDQVVWLYVYRDFSKSPADLAAERISLRFGVTSWPQHFLADPADFEILRDTGRSVESFTAAVTETQIPTDPEGDAVARLAAADALAIRLEKDAPVALALDHILDDDLVVRMRALQALMAAEHDAIGRHAVALLATPSDPLRFAVCDFLGSHPDPRAAAPLTALVEDPTGSLNPNVLRISAVRALALCGDAESIEAIAPHATSGAYFNGLTGVAIATLARLGERYPDHREEVLSHLIAAYPLAVSEEDARAERACLALARKVHEALVAITGRNLAFPEAYDEDARSRLQEAW